MPKCGSGFIEFRNVGTRSRISSVSKCLPEFVSLCTVATLAEFVRMSCAELSYKILTGEFKMMSFQYYCIILSSAEKVEVHHSL